MHRSVFIPILLLTMPIAQMRPATGDAPATASTATPAWETWERAQAERHGAVAATDAGQLAGDPDDASIGITPDHAGPVAVQRVKELGAGAIRNGVTRNYAEHDPALEPWIRAGIPVHPVISPRWECPRGRYDIGKNDMSEWYANWQSWCHDIFTHYKGRVFYYILDNEPDLAGDKAAVYTPAQAVEFTRIAYLEAKTIDPRIRIESPPTNSPETGYLRRMIQLGVGNYCDAIGVHVYGSEINDGRFDKPWKWMQQYGVYKPIAASEAGVAVTWGRGPDGKRDPQIWRRNWEQLYYTQIKRFGISSTLLFSLYGTYDGDFSYVNPQNDAPVQPIFNEVRYGHRRRPFANGGFEQPNVFQREWVIVYGADADGAPDSATFVRGDASGAHSGSGYLKLDTAGSAVPVTVRRVAANLKPGYVYTLSGWASVQGTGAATLAAQGFDLTAGNREAAATTKATSKWQKLSARFMPTATWAVVALSAQSPDGTGSLVKWDDIVLSAPSLPSKPSAPENVGVFPTDRLVTLRWTPAGNAAAYNVYRASRRDGPYLLAHAGVVGTPFTDWGVANGQVYYYRIAAVNGAGEGPRSTAVAATPNPAAAVSAEALALPDLVVTGIALTPPNPAAGDRVSAQATIKNVGKAATLGEVPSTVTISIDGVLIGWSDDHTAEVAPGESVTLRLNGGGNAGHTWTAVSGKHTLTAVADDINRIDESNKENNTLEKTFSVP